MKTNEFFTLGLQQIRDAIAQLERSNAVCVKGKGLMPEADVLLCTLSGRRFNIKVDLTYGAEVQAVEPIPVWELLELERKILAVAFGTPQRD